jgi:lipid-A-disaccharide synthase-like uncharacterized protein
MNTTHLLIFIIGFTSQVLFFARTIVQWFLSEKEGKVLSPMLFWKISLFASVLMLIYGILRNDFAIILGQLLVYYIYIRNLQLQGAWIKMKKYLRIIFSGLPLFCMIWVFASGQMTFATLFHSENISLWLLVLGIVAQLVFTFRFVYQWLFSEKRKESHLPLGFWYISILGSLMILFYAIMRRDPVLFLGHTGSMIMYLRNVLLHFNGKGIHEYLPIERIRQKGKSSL